MASLTYIPPKVVFPHELDTVGIEQEGPAACEVEIKIAGAVAFHSTLYFDDNGFITIRDLANLFRSFVTDAAAKVDIYLDGSLTASTTCLPCEVDLDMRAVDFVPKFFLTRCEGVKRVQENSVELLYFYALDTGETWSLTAVVSQGNNITEMVVDSGTKVIAGYLLIRVDMPTLQAKCEGRILEIKVLCGERTFRLINGWFLPSGFSVTFRNAFGKPENMSLALAQKKFSVNPEEVAIGGKRKTITVKKTREYKCFTGDILEPEIGLVEDLAASTDVASLDGVPLVVKSVDFTYGDLDTQPINASVTFEEATQAPSFRKKLPPKTFDKTFDKSFN